MSDESSDLPLGGGQQETTPHKEEKPILPKISRPKIPGRPRKAGAGLNRPLNEQEGFGLNDRQIRFCLAILKGENGTNAAKSAGYSERSASAHSTYLLQSPKVAAYIAAHRKQTQEAAAAATLTDAKWVRQRLLEESKYYGKDATQAARIRAVELIAKLNGDFEADNKQKAGVFDGIPAEALDFVRERLRERGVGDDSGIRPAGGGFTH